MIKQKNLTQGKIVWKANKLKSPALGLLIALTALGGFFSYIVTEISSKIIFGFFTLVLLYSLFRSFSSQISIWSNGIKMDSFKRIKVAEYSLKQRKIFIEWNNIREISVINYLVGISYVKNPKPFLKVKTKKGKKYECILYDKAGFMNAIRKIKKDHLIKGSLQKEYYEK